MTPQEFIEKGEYQVKFRWLDKKTQGLIDFKSQTIYLNLELFVASTFVHELAHYLDETASEKQILEREEKRIERMTVKEIRQLARRLLRNWKGGAR